DDRGRDTAHPDHRVNQRIGAELRRETVEPGASKAAEKTSQEKRGAEQAAAKAGADRHGGSHDLGDDQPEEKRQVKAGMQDLHDAAMTAPEDLPERERNCSNNKAPDRWSDPARHCQGAKQCFSGRHALHDEYAEPGRGQAETEEPWIIGGRNADFVPDDEDRRRADETTHYQRPG